MSVRIKELLRTATTRAPQPNHVQVVTERPVNSANVEHPTLRHNPTPRAPKCAGESRTPKQAYHISSQVRMDENARRILERRW